MEKLMSFVSWETRISPFVTLSPRSTYTFSSRPAYLGEISTDSRGTVSPDSTTRFIMSFFSIFSTFTSGWADVFPTLTRLRWV